MNADSSDRHILRLRGNIEDGAQISAVGSIGIERRGDAVAAVHRTRARALRSLALGIAAAIELGLRENAPDAGIATIAQSACVAIIARLVSVLT